MILNSPHESMVSAPHEPGSATFSPHTHIGIHKFRRSRMEMKAAIPLPVEESLFRHSPSDSV